MLIFEKDGHLNLNFQKGSIPESPIQMKVEKDDGTHTYLWVGANRVGGGTPEPSTECFITSFKIGTAVGTIDETATPNPTIAVTVPTGTDVTALKPTIKISADASVNPASKVAQNFTNPVNYVVTAESSTTSTPVTRTYTVTITVAS